MCIRDRPNAVDGIVTGCILAIGRIVGESAALLFTAGFGLVLNSFAESLQSSSATLTVALYIYASERGAVSYTHLDVYKRQSADRRWCIGPAHR